MLEFICNIPDTIGWCIVGTVAFATVILGFFLGKTIIEMIQNRREDEESEEEI